MSNRYFSFPSSQRSIAIWAAAAIAVVAFAANDAFAAARSAGDAALFDRLDANRDGLLSRDEIPAKHERLFVRLLRRAGIDDAGSLPRKEFLEALIPSRPEKQIESKQPASSPQADAVRYLLLTIDTNLNSVVEPDEVPDDCRRVFEAMVGRLDRNDNGSLEPPELSRGSRPLAQLAERYVSSRRINLSAELENLEKSQGKAVKRFDGGRPPVEMLGDPKQARALFDRLDANRDEYVEPDEVPEPFQPQVERFMRLADRDQDGRLSKREFLLGAERISRFMSRNR
jgi:EF hand